MFPIITSLSSLHALFCATQVVTKDSKIKKELRSALPAEVFEISTLKSSLYLAADYIILIACGFVFPTAPLSSIIVACLLS